MLVSPAVKVPQFTELIGKVHALLEYKPQFADAATVPLGDAFAELGDALGLFGGTDVLLEGKCGDLETSSMEGVCGDIVVMAPKVVSDKASPIMTKATTTGVVFGSFRFEATSGVVFGNIVFRFLMRVMDTVVALTATAIPTAT